MTTGVVNEFTSDIVSISDGEGGLEYKEPLFLPERRVKDHQGGKHFQSTHQHVPGEEPLSEVRYEGIVLGGANHAEAGADVHEGCNDRTHGGGIVHVVTYGHYHSTNKYHKDVDDEVADCKADDPIIYGPAVEADGNDGHWLEKDLANGVEHVFADDGVMDNLDPAGCGTGTGADKADYIEKHLGSLRPLFIIGSAETGGR